MLDFDLDAILDEMKGRSIQEKLEQLNSLYNELEEAAQELRDRMTAMNDEYTESVLSTIKAGIQSLITEKHWNKGVILKDGLYKFKTEEAQVYVNVICVQGEWSIHINTDISNNEKRYDTLSSLAQLLDLPYKRGNDEIIRIVEEEYLSSAITNIFTRLCG